MIRRVVNSICMTEICNVINELICNNKNVARKVKHTESLPLLCYYEIAENESENLKQKTVMLTKYFNDIRIGLLNNEFRENELLNLIWCVDSPVLKLKNRTLRNLMKEVKERAEAELDRIRELEIFRV